jgi:hypothetical protein
MLHFCTYFDSNFLARGLVLYDSLREHCAPFELFVLCLDNSVHEELCRRNLPSIVPVPVEAIEAAYPDLILVKPTRSRVEYYYTCGPAFIHYLLTRYPAIDLLMYVDADLYFFGGIGPILEELDGYSIGIIEHRFSPRLRRGAKFGIYNVGWVAFRNNGTGRTCVDWWRARCIEWCYERCEGDRYADQKYLEQWPRLFDGVRVVQHKGANVAPWNLGRYKVDMLGDRIAVDGQPLIFFHFHGLKQVWPRLFDTNLGRSGARLSPVLRKHLFLPYIQALQRSPGKTVAGGVRKRSAYRGMVGRWAKAAWHNLATLFSGAFIIAPIE